MAETNNKRPILEVAGVHVTFKARQALKGVSLSLKAGEVLVLLGPNGAGKSTLIRVISGRLVPDLGTVGISGRDPGRDGKARRQIGIVPQNIALFERLSARENLEAFGRLMGLDRKQIGPAVGAALSRVGLLERAGDRVGSLSGGMRRRINIAAALMHEPKVLILDEPTAGLDYQSQAGLVALLRGLRTSGLAILLTTHDMVEAEALADRIAVLVGGEVRAEGTAQSLVAAAFGGQRELTLKLASSAMARAGDRVSTALNAAGLSPLTDGRTWTGLVEGKDESFESLISAVLATSGVVEDVRVGRPGLDAVLRRLVESAQPVRSGARI